jgi:hypothetical protein
MSNKLDNHLAQVTADPPSKKKKKCISVPDFLLFVLSFLRIPFTNEFKEKNTRNFCGTGGGL